MRGDAAAEAGVAGPASAARLLVAGRILVCTGRRATAPPAVVARTVNCWVGLGPAGRAANRRVALEPAGRAASCPVAVGPASRAARCPVALGSAGPAADCPVGVVTTDERAGGACGGPG